MREPASLLNRLLGATLLVGALAMANSLLLPMAARAQWPPPTSGPTSTPLPCATASFAPSIQCGTCSPGDNVECPNPGNLALTDIAGPPLPRNAFEANYTFNHRAAIILEYAACRVPSFVLGTVPTAKPSNPPPIGSGVGATLYSFEKYLGSWGQDALAQLAYPGSCGQTSAAARFNLVDDRLAQISVPADLHLGSSADAVAGITSARTGELDFGLAPLITILYLYRNEIPVSFSHILDILRQQFPSDAPVLPSPPTYSLSMPIFGAAVIPETENHTLLILSEQYLSGQLLGRDNTRVHNQLMAMIKGILTSDFFEYNSKPYQHYALYAMENLTDFARDSDLQTAARMVLDFAAAKFAVSSSLLRRSSPYRRRLSHAGNLLTGSDADEQLCRFYLYSGQLQAAYNGGVYTIGGGCASAVREAIGTYRVPNVILQLAINKSAPYFQTFSGGQSYYASQWGAAANCGFPVPGPVEIYDNEGPFLIAAGGIPQPNGLPATLPASLVGDSNVLSKFVIPLLTSGPEGAIANAIGKAAYPTAYATYAAFAAGGIQGLLADQGRLCDNTMISSNLDDLGVSVPTVLIPYDPVTDPSSLHARQPLDDPIVDRNHFVRIGILDDMNLCVAPGFACGKNPAMPLDMRSCGASPVSPCVQQDGPWQFAIIPSAPVQTYVAMLAAPADFISKQIAQMQSPDAGWHCSISQWPFQIGLFEAEPANRFVSFGDFQQQVKSKNPEGTGLLVEQDGYEQEVDMLQGFWYSGAPISWRSHPPYCSPVGGETHGQSGPSGGTYLVVGWKGHYVKTDGTALDFTIATPFWGDSPQLINGQNVNPPPFPASNYAVQYSRGPATDSSRWDLADGPVLASHSGLISIRDPVTGGYCTLDITNVNSPSRTCYDNPARYDLHSGFIIQSSSSLGASSGGISLTADHFEIVVPEGNRLAHYWRDNNAPGQPWHQLGDVVSYGVSLGTGSTQTIKGASLLHTTWGDLEVVAWIHQVATQIMLGSGVHAVTSDFLELFRQDTKTQKWSDTSMMEADGKYIEGVTGTPAFIQGTNGKQGNFEMVVPEGNRLAYYWRDNDARGQPWHQGDDVVSYGVSPGTGSTQTIKGASLLHTTWGDLEVVAWIHQVATQIMLGSGVHAVTSDFLELFRQDTKTQKWSGTSMMEADGKYIEGVTGPASFVQSKEGRHGNFEIVVPEGGRLANYWRDNDAPGTPWHQANDVVSFESSERGSATINDATLLQDADGNLNVIAWLHGTALTPALRTVTSDYLVSSFRDPAEQFLSASNMPKWSSFSTITVNGNPILNVSGPQ